MRHTIAAVMRHIRNFFERECYEGEITITGGVVSPGVKAPFVFIRGSQHHDGLWETASSALVEDGHPDETFAGCIWYLYPPDDFLALCGRIADYEAQNPVGALQSESLEGYSYSRATGRNGGLQSWQDAFATRLAPFRRMFSEVG